MFTRSMFTGSSFKAPEIELDPSLSSAGDRAVKDLSGLVHRADVSHRVETSLDAATDVIRNAVDHLPGRRERRARLSLGPALVMVGLLAIVGFAALWMLRSSALSAGRRLDEDFDEDNLETAATDGPGNPASATADDTSSLPPAVGS